MEKELKELLENFRSMTRENQKNLLTYAHITRSAENGIKKQYGLLPGSIPAQAQPAQSGAGA